MFFPKKSAILFLFAASFVWAQQQTVAGTSTEQGTASTVEASPKASSLPDSTTLEPLEMKKAGYPLQAATKGIQGQVIVELHVSEEGKVEGVDVVSGDPILAESAVKAAKKWKFKPFIKNGKPVKVDQKMPFDFFFNEKVMTKGASVDRTATSNADNSPMPASVGGQAKTSSTDASKLPQRVQVSAGVTEGLLVHQIAPVYPEQARRTSIQGHVILNAVIGKDGRIAQLKPVAGPKELFAAAIGAVQQWRYKPYMLMGQPVEVETIIDINFQLR